MCDSSPFELETQFKMHFVALFNELVRHNFLRKQFKIKGSKWIFFENFAYICLKIWIV